MHSRGAQRHSLEKLRQWEQLGFGMFLHFGMSTFVGDEFADGTAEPLLYAPAFVDADQWCRVARDAGMKYLVITAKHVAGHCLWPSKHTAYTVERSANKADVMAELANACAKYGLGLGFYYCSWDNHNRFGTVTAGDVGIFQSTVTSEYLDFQLRQLEELLTGYGPILEVWIDIPQVLGAQGRRACYDLCASLQPETFVIMNQGSRGGSTLDIEHAWPFDISTREKQFPECGRWGQGENGTTRGHVRWYSFGIEEQPGSEPYYIPTEVCETIGYHWFHFDEDEPRSSRELRAMHDLAQERSANLLLNVPPDRTGRIPARAIQALT
jgi:alpha-L-fucosidase